MICEKHNLFIRIGKCPLCIVEIEKEIQLDFEIRMLEKEIRESIQIWP